MELLPMHRIHRCGLAGRTGWSRRGARATMPAAVGPSFPLASSRSSRRSSRLDRLRSLV